MAAPVADSFLNAIGGTPVVRLRRFVPAGAADVLVKLESLNPTGSYQRFKREIAVLAGGCSWPAISSRRKPHA